MKPLNTTWIAGMPRSGTSWLGQIFDSHPQVIYRLSPFFSYAFKDAVTTESSCEQIKQVLEEILGSQDEFMTQASRREAGEYPVFELKNELSRNLVIKDTRYHNLLDKMLAELSDLKVVYIVRNPGGMINSWIKAPREFELKGCTLDKDWKTGACRKSGPEEFWGFDDWVKLTRYYEKLEATDPDRVMVIQYEALVENAGEVMTRVFAHCGLDMHPQAAKFIYDSQHSDVEGTYAVFRNKSEGHEKWRRELPEYIQAEIEKTLQSLDLNTFYV